MIHRFTATILIISVILSCKDKNVDSSQDFELLPRNSYFVDSHNDIGIYRLNDSKKVMNGYYVIGDKISKWEEFNVINGVLNGDYIIFHSNGEIYSHSQYKKGKLHGEEKFYSLSGNLQKLNTYKFGQLYGKKLRYYDNGQLQSESKVEDEEVVESITYNQIGEITSQMFIEDGLQIRQTISGGKVFSEDITSTYDNFHAMKFYNEDGTLKVYFKMLEEDNKAYIIELDEQGNEIKRIDVKANPNAFAKYLNYLQ